MLLVDGNKKIFGFFTSVITNEDFQYVLIVILLFNTFDKLIHKPKKSKNDFINGQESMINTKSNFA